MADRDGKQTGLDSNENGHRLTSYDELVDLLVSKIERLRHPQPGSRIDAARKFGVDLNLLIANLRLTPAERVNKMHEACTAAEQIRGIARSRKS